MESVFVLCGKMYLKCMGKYCLRLRGNVISVALELESETTGLLELCRWVSNVFRAKSPHLTHMCDGNYTIAWSSADRFERPDVRSKEAFHASQIP